MNQFQTDFGYLRYHDFQGEKPPILFIHGLGCCGSMDYPQVASNPLLSNHRKIIVDLIGSGFSDSSDNFDYTIENQAKVLSQLISYLKIDRLIIYGHSMGGSIAISLAETIENKVDSLIISEANLDNGGGFFSKKVAAYNYQDFEAFGFQEIIEENIKSKNELWAKSLSITKPIAIYEEAKSLIKGNEKTWRNIFYQLNVPKTFVFGEFSLPDMDFETLPNQGVKIEVVKNAGHSMAWENPDGLAEAIFSGISNSK